MENPLLWTSEFRKEIKVLFNKAVELEYAYAQGTMSRGVLGLNATMFKGYLRYGCKDDSPAAPANKNLIRPPLRAERPASQSAGRTAS